MKKIILILFTLSLSLLVTCADGLEEMLGNLGNKVPICVRSDAPDGGNGRGWATAYNNLQAAIDAVPAGSELWVAGEFIINASVTINKPITFIGGFAGTETKLEERGPDSKTSVKGNISTSNCFTINSTDIKFDGFRFHDSSITSGCIINIPETFSLNISNCVFENNNASSNTGGSVIRSYGLLSIIDSNFLKNSSNNSGVVSGGAIQLASKSVTTINRCTFNENWASNGTVSGGAICALTCTLSILDSEFNNNYLTGSDTKGGALYNSSSSVTIRNTKFTGNHVVNSGGAICSNDSITIINNSEFTNNYSTGGSAGAIYATGNTSTMTISSTEFNGNYSSGNGGAIVAYNIKSCTINSNANLKSSFKNNYTTLGGARGGALFCNILTTLAITDTEFSSNGYLADSLPSGTSNAKTGYGGAISLDTITNCTITQTTIDKNKASENGGGINSKLSTVTINNDSKITNNESTTGASSGFGGGIYIDGGTYEISSSTLQNNSAKCGGGVYSNGSGTTTLKLSTTEISDNSSTSSVGAGICINGSSSSTIFIAQSTKFVSNTSGMEGGAICFNNAELDTSVINMCRFYKNSSGPTTNRQPGGAIYYRGIPDKLSINNSIFDWNNGSDGSAVYTIAALTFRNLTFYHNDTKGTGALYSSAPSVIYNSVFWKNTRGGPGAADIYLVTGTFLNSFYDSGESNLNGCTIIGTITPTGISPFLSEDIQNSNYLKPSSVLINQGNNLYVSGSYDVAGNPRTVGIVDVGAYEAQ